jgi:hypothetical protein
MRTATSEIEPRGSALEQQLLEQVLQAGRAFREATEESRATARQRYAEVLGRFNRLLKSEVGNNRGAGWCYSERPGQSMYY